MNVSEASAYTWSNHLAVNTSASIFTYSALVLTDGSTTHVNPGGHEWTETETVSDLSDTVTADEIIEVHEALEAGKTFKEMVE